jgi:hypothetical protein
MPSHVILHKTAIQTDGGTDRDVGIAEMEEVESRRIDHMEFNGLDICVENQTGTFREGDGWKVFMEYPYGYIDGVTGADGEELDCFVGPNQNAEFVYIIHIVDPVTDNYDEDKVFLGFDNLDDVVRVFSLHYNDAEEFIDEVSVMEWDDFLLAINKNPDEPDFSESAVVDSEQVHVEKDPSSGLVMIKRILSKAGEKRAIVLDFDGVLHSYKSGWEGAENIPDDPVPGAFDFLHKLKDDFTIYILSARSSQPGGIEAMKQWISRWDDQWRETHRDTDEENIVESINFPKSKPPADIYLDDNAIRFNGRFPTIDTIKESKSWVKKGLFKAKAAQVGEVREWGGVKYRKGSEGWERVKTGDGGGEKPDEGGQSDEGEKPDESKTKISPVIAQRKEQIKEGFKSALRGIFEVMSEGLQGKAAEQTAAGTVEETGGELQRTHPVKPEPKAAKEQSAEPTPEHTDGTAPPEPTGAKSMRPSPAHVDRLTEQAIEEIKGDPERYDQNKLRASIEAGIPAGYEVKMYGEPIRFDGEGSFVDSAGNKIQLSNEQIDSFLIGKAQKDARQ